MKKNKYFLFFSMLSLIMFGITMIYSASHIWAEYKFNDPLKYIKSQVVFFLFGLLIIKILSKIPISFYRNNANKLILLCLILLILVLIPGIGKVRNGSRSWFGIGPLGIQPSEFAKLGLIIFTAKYLSSNDKDIKNIRKGILPIFLIISIFFLLIMMEPDFGTALVILCTLVVMIFSSGPNLSFFVKIGMLGLIGIILLIIVAPYRVARITAYLNPWSDPLGSGFQIIQSLYALGPHGLLGVGYGNSIQKNFYLPEPQTDFIFSIIGEEFGFLGCFFVIFLFLCLFYNAIKISLSQYDLFAKYLSFGLSFGLVFQGLLNIAIVSGLLPTTGITLPFISYGGSSLLVSMISIGIIISIAKE